MNYLTFEKYIFLSIGIWKRFVLRRNKKDSSVKNEKNRKKFREKKAEWNHLLEKSYTCLE
ncbi:hypothetical protein ACO2J1_05665 [Leptospira interrogans]|uniref:Uncharacterized protein n=1 Tax=Leptospira interrogans str. FPW1039 TaxID=1193040 RepID=A0A0F6ID00_LEPIR|nr:MULTISPECIES: hypothetical protein [Leptospira]EJO80154.1 hypothetical protein LEP1GSC045_0496 [Leptospira interrogans serovar Pomona str. Kennewicki LC82-25]EKN95895.1 hypothetical protein LEP1GSC014_4368 [Leptospira interrogans serovar Pomona str. Pomona]EKO71902.1 hypothetical protein LEP1GSC069_0498 [Leptospira interrogans serovar Canicola str. Fiocruz LV133]EKR34094.1 hypothetical protein LEP1GSC096_2535 [Leptospira interrogans serovar Hebdomadis str. R499]EKR83466.1 hypothetical prote